MVGEISSTFWIAFPNVFFQFQIKLKVCLVILISEERNGLFAHPAILTKLTSLAISTI